MCCWLSSLTLQLLPFAGDWAAACRVLRAISRAPSWFLFPPIKPPAWTKIQPLIPLSSDSASSRTPRHSSSRDSLGQGRQKGKLVYRWTLCGPLLTSCWHFGKTHCAVQCLHNQQNYNYKTQFWSWIMVMNYVNEISIKEQNKTATIRQLTSANWSLFKQTSLCCFSNVKICVFFVAFLTFY